MKKLIFFGLLILVTNVFAQGPKDKKGKIPETPKTEALDTLPVAMLVSECIGCRTFCDAGYAWGPITKQDTSEVTISIQGYLDYQFKPFNPKTVIWMVRKL